MGNPKKTKAEAVEVDVVATAATEEAATEAAPTEAAVENEVAAQTEAQEQPQSQPQEPKADIEPLDDFLRRIEVAHIARDVVATAATHPHATDRVWPGTYGGIRLSAGPVSVTYSDGTTE